MASDRGGVRKYTDPMVARIGPRRPFRQYLKEWRETRGLTQQQLADRLETGKDQISRWENGKRGMGAEVIAALSEALQLEPGDLFRDPAVPSADELLRKATPEERRLAIDLVLRVVGDRR
jgi:transcriptional regulator with XRE-family HTH domain